MLRLRSLIASIALTALLLISGGRALAHSEFVSSTPPPGSKLAAAPTSVTIVFSEELKPAGNSIAVTDAAGKRVDTGDATLLKTNADRKTLTVALVSGLPNGSYAVAWRNSSADGHAEEGTFAFGVDVPAAVPAGLPRTGGEPELLGELLLFAALAIGAASRHAARA